MNKGVQGKLTRVRPPRVKITYDVETEGSSKKVELPYVIGVISHLHGHNDKNANIDQDFCSIDNDNIDNYMKYINPKLKYTVKNLLDKNNDEARMKIELNFESREDFEVKNVIKQIPECSRLHKIIKALNELQVMLDGNERLDETLKEILIDEKIRFNVKQEIESKLQLNK